MHVARNISVISVPPAVEVTISTEGQVSLALSYFLTVFATFMVILRFWSRKLSRFGIALDDWLTLATLVLLYIVLALSVVLVYEGGVGKPMSQALREQPMAPVTSLKLLYGLEWTYLFASPLMKLSVLAYYWRIFPTKHMKKYIRILTAVCAIWFVGVLIGNLVECRPISFFWNKLSAPGTGICHFRVEVYLIIVAAPNIVIDTLTIILPVYEIWHLQLERWKRIAVSGIFVVGGMVVIASIIRLILLIGFYFKHSADLTNNLVLPWFVTLAEIGVGIVGACLPCLMPLYRRFWHKATGSTTSGYGGDYGGKSSLRSHLRSHMRSHTNHGRTIGSNTVIAGHSGGKKHLSGSLDPGHPFERLSTPGNAPDDDVPLQGIHIRHEVTIQHSAAAWYQEGKM
ncbi:hypothetical protein KVR01_002359 [Diaporthe batatas]|uniref:uncharacterized protein n=1 Tax=Diaporthe batatas TaxID=748121 RepID=UPI001D05223D|nr:uncharacterized protein KVR01_002359 [Diaporthe batatas]KAG8166670.1 hypothetical protein KVR01_002359 [Diaporthe batatas]